MQIWQLFYHLETACPPFCNSRLQFYLYYQINHCVYYANPCIEGNKAVLFNLSKLTVTLYMLGDGGIQDSQVFTKYRPTTPLDIEKHLTNV